MLSRDDWLPLARKLDWDYSYVREDEVFPAVISGAARHEPVPVSARTAARCGNSASRISGLPKKTGSPPRKAKLP